MKLDQLMDAGHLATMIEEGYVRDVPQTQANTPPVDCDWAVEPWMNKNMR